MCYEGENDSKSSAAESCAKSAGMDYSLLETCVGGEEGKAVDSMNAKATALIPGGHASTPWPVINGAALDEGTDLLKAVCGAYTGTKPAFC